MGLAWRTTGLMMVVVGALALSGCTYMKDRGNDALDILDLGVTFSSEPHVAAYCGFQSLLGVGYSDVDGKLAGLGQRHFGWLDMRYHAAGAVLEGYEQWGYNDYDSKDANSPKRRGVGLGLIYHERPSTVTEALQCGKFVHLGWIGFDLNCKLGEILDFLCGWTTLDLGKDDKYSALRAEPGT